MRARVATIAIVALLAAVGASVAIAALNGSGRQTAADGSAHPCDRIPTSALSPLVGAKVSVERRSAANRAQVCRWGYPLPGVTFRSTDPRTAGTIEIGVWHGRRYYVPDAAPDRFTALSGAGDAAHYSATFLTLRKGDTVLVIQARIGFEAFRTAAELDLWLRLAVVAAGRY